MWGKIISVWTHSHKATAVTEAGQYFHVELSERLRREGLAVGDMVEFTAGTQRPINTKGIPARNLPALGVEIMAKGYKSPAVENCNSQSS